jgi:hypothetical protein
MDLGIPNGQVHMQAILAVNVDHSFDEKRKDPGSQALIKKINF